jgi:hypothetical protein
MTSDQQETPPHTVMERMLSHEERLKVLEAAMTKAFGEHWMLQIETRVKAEPDGQ